MKSIPLEELQEMARQLTVRALEGFAIPENVRNNLVLGVFFEEGYRVFELYVPGERPADARVIARARMNIKTGEGSVEVIGLPHK